jgi:EmrB/QacA subfamily drug resistance transporter
MRLSSRIVSVTSEDPARTQDGESGARSVASTMVPQASVDNAAKGPAAAQVGGAPLSGAAQLGLSSRQIWIILGSLMMGTVLSAVDTTILATALPTIVGDLGGFESLAWVGTAYILTSTIATPILGKLGDLFGRRRIVLSAIWILLAGSLLGAVAQSTTVLIVARAIQGIGGGGIQALTFAIIGDLVSPRERGRYMGAYTSIFVLSGIAGPILGGFMIERFAWQWIFLINIPIGLLAIAAIMATLKIPQKRREARIDFVGAGLLALTLAALVLGLESGKRGWLRVPVGLWLVGALCALMVFLRQEKRAAEPIIPLRLFKNRIFATTAAMGFCAGGLSYGTQTFLPLFFQSAQFRSATVAGLLLVPIMMGVMLGSGFLGREIARTGRYKRYPVITLSLALIGSLALSQISRSASYLWLVVPMFLTGLGVGTTFTTTSIASQNAIDHRDIGVGTATLTSLRSLGGSICLALFGTLHATTVVTELRSRVPIESIPTDTPITSLIKRPEQIRGLPVGIRTGIADALTVATGRVYLFSALVALLGLILALKLEERPLRS